MPKIHVPRLRPAKPKEGEKHFIFESILPIDKSSRRLSVPPDDWRGSDQFAPMLVSSCLVLLSIIWISIFTISRPDASTSVFRWIAGTVAALTFVHGSLRVARDIELHQKWASLSWILVGLGIAAAPLTLTDPTAAFVKTPSRVPLDPLGGWVLAAMVISILLCGATVFLLLNPRKTKFVYNAKQRTWNIFESRLLFGGTSYGGSYAQIKHLVVTLRTIRARSRFMNVQDSLGWDEDVTSAVVDTAIERVKGVSLPLAHIEKGRLEVLRQLEDFKLSINQRELRPADARLRLDTLLQGAQFAFAQGGPRCFDQAEYDALVGTSRASAKNAAAVAEVSFRKRLKLRLICRRMKRLYRYYRDHSELATGRKQFELRRESILRARKIDSVQGPLDAWLDDASVVAKYQEASANVAPALARLIQLRSAMRIGRLLRWFPVREWLIYRIKTRRRDSLGRLVVSRPSRVIPTVVLYAVVDRDPDLPLEIRHYPVLSYNDLVIHRFKGPSYPTLDAALAAAAVDAMDLGAEIPVRKNAHELATDSNAGENPFNVHAGAANALEKLAGSSDELPDEFAFARRRRALIAALLPLGDWLQVSLLRQEQEKRPPSTATDDSKREMPVSLDLCRRQFRIIINQAHTVIGVPAPIDDTSHLHPFFRYVGLRFASRASRASADATASSIGEQMHGVEKMSRPFGVGLKVVTILAGVFMTAMFAGALWTLGAGVYDFIKNARDEGISKGVANELVVEGLHALELMILAPLPYLLMLGLTRYVSALSRNKDAKKAKAELLDFKAFEVALLISAFAAFIISVFFESNHPSKGNGAVAILVQDMIDHPPLLFAVCVVIIILVGYYALLEVFAERQGDGAKANPTDVVPYVFEAERLIRQERFRDAAEMYDRAAYFIMANSVRADMKALYYEAMADACRLVLAREAADEALKRSARAGFITHLLELHEMEKGATRTQVAPTQLTARNRKSQGAVAPLVSLAVVSDRNPLGLSELSNSPPDNAATQSVEQSGLTVSGSESVLSHGVIAFATEHEITGLRSLFLLMMSEKKLDALQEASDSDLQFA